MTRPTFSLLYTSARQDQIPRIIQLWESRADRPFQVEWCITCDGGIFHGEWDGTLDWNKLPRHRFKFDCVKNPPHNCTRGWNLAAKISAGKILVLVSDDIVPPEKWDVGILAAVEKNFHTTAPIPEGREIDYEWVMHVDDGTEDKKLTHAIMSRARYEKFGYWFHPSYESMYNDSELWVVAKRDNVIINAKHLLFDHEHFYFYKREQDSVDRQHSSAGRYETGNRLFDWREKNGFPAPANVVPQSKSDYVAYMQVNKDDFFLLEICERLADEGVTKFFFHVPTTTWSGREIGVNDAEPIHLIAAILNKRLGKDAATVFFHTCPFDASLSRIERETHVRNAALYELRKSGNPFILIVDGDELWKSGTLDKVHSLAVEGVQAIGSEMIDVAGMPAYPIDSKGHVATIYVGPDTDLQYCRVPYAPVFHIEGRNIYHFSAVRKTREELFAKMRESGHYDDSRYLFEHWIHNVLPNIKPGARNVHMFDNGSRWPLVRDWDESDWSHIPEPIKVFLKS